MKDVMYKLSANLQALLMLHCNRNQAQLRYRLIRSTGQRALSWALYASGNGWHRTYRVVGSYDRGLHVPWPQLGALARARLDGLSRSDQFSGTWSTRHPLHHLHLDCLGFSFVLTHGDISHP
jgi:hypothetical protein